MQKPRQRPRGAVRDHLHRVAAYALLTVFVGIVCHQAVSCFVGASHQPRSVRTIGRDRPMDRNGESLDATVVADYRESQVAADTAADSTSTDSDVGDVGSDGLPVVGTPTYKAKMALLRRVSRLERGNLANEIEDKKVRNIAEKLRLAAEAEKQWSVSLDDDLSRLEGRWELLYTSGFVRKGFVNRGGRGQKYRGPPASLGGLRYGPPLDGPTLEVGAIEQVYRTGDRQADTVVTLRPPKWLRETGLVSQVLSLVPFMSENPDTEIKLTQQFDVASSDTLRFAFLNGQATPKVFEQLMPLRFPMSLFGLPETSRDTPFTDTLQTTYCDDDIRIGVGGKFGEMRVFRKVHSVEV